MAASASHSAKVAESLVAIDTYILQQVNNIPHLLSRDVDGYDPWLDPADPIKEDQVARASRKMNVSPEKAQIAYEDLQKRLNGKLQLAWLAN